jgi:signal transduction histidine kinase
MHESMLRARLGEVVSTISQLDDEENKDLGVTYKQLLETYSPIRLSGTDQIIAIAEFYQQTGDLELELANIKLNSWLVVGISIFLIYLLLAGFVHNASDTIQRQKTDLGQKVIQLTDLLEQNRELSERVRRASARVAQLNESYLKRIGSELHDGPAQDLGLSILKLDALAGRLEKDNAQNEVASQLNEIGISLQNALKEIRGIAAGLSLPQLVNLNLSETVERVVRAHERRTATHVELDIQPLPERVPLPLQITIYRVIQEALNNAFRHAGGIGQRVRVDNQSGQILLIISDDGPGFDERLSTASGRLGLNGMRERVESLGGLFKIDSQSGRGTTILVQLPCQIEGETSL